jgi:hypothetical protein
VTYSHFVFGENNQQPFHKASGFKTESTLEKEIAADLEARLKDYVEKLKA